MSQFSAFLALVLTGGLVSALPSLADKSVDQPPGGYSSGEARAATWAAAKAETLGGAGGDEVAEARGGEVANADLPLGVDARELSAAFDEPTFDTILGTYRTRYRRSGGSRGRAHNVEQATRLLNGAIIAPGAHLSFNDRVGERDRRNGFRQAPVIDGGRIVPGMGGGVCQVASTLHAAALLGGLEMTQYRPHSRPSSYIAMGLDATVSFPQIDFEVQNPFDFPIEVRARTEGGRVYVDLVGRAQPREVELSRQVLNHRPFEREIVEDATLEAGTEVVEQRGVRGARIARTRTFVEDGETHVERQVVRYPPTVEVVRVGVGPAPVG